MENKTGRLHITKTAQDLINEGKGAEIGRPNGEIEEIVLPETTADMFKPSRDMQKLKAAFYSLSKNKMIDPESITADVVNKATGSNLVFNWWRNESFVAWFKNADDIVAKINYLLAVHLSNLEEIMINADGLYSAKDLLAAGKQISELSADFQKMEQNAPATMSPEQVKELALKMMEAKKLKAKPEPKQTKVELPT